MAIQYAYCKCGANLAGSIERFVHKQSRRTLSNPNRLILLICAETRNACGYAYHGIPIRPKKINTQFTVTRPTLFLGADSTFFYIFFFQTNVFPCHQLTFRRRNL